MPLKQIKEKIEIKEKLEKESKEHKDKLEKEHKEKLEKEAKEHKEKLEKEHGKEIHKEVIKVEQLEVIQPQIPDPTAQQAMMGANMPAMSADMPATAATVKLPEKFIAEKPVNKLEYDKYRKLEHEKIFKIEKQEIYEYAGPGSVAPGDPVEQRLTALENAMAQLVHFIPQEMRPDLSKGALKQEPTQAEAQQPEEEKK